MVKEKFTAVFHKRHGWISAPEGMWFEESDNGKSYWLCSETDPEPGTFFPFGTRFNATSILNVA